MNMAHDSSIQANPTRQLIELWTLYFTIICAAKPCDVLSGIVLLLFLRIFRGLPGLYALGPGVLGTLFVASVCRIHLDQP